MAQPAWITIARGEIGVKEMPGAVASADILKYHAVTGRWASDEVPWCGSFVAWCMLECGLLKSAPPSLNLALAISWLKFGVECDLRPGAIVVIKTALGHHVTFCVQISADSFLGLGGNQHNECKISGYRRAQIVGCRWPKEATLDE